MPLTFSQSITQSIGFGEGCDEQSEDTSPKMTVAEQEIAWNDMWRYFIADVRPISPEGQRYFSAYSRTELTIQAQVRLRGFHSEPHQFAGEVYDLLEFWIV